MKFKYLVQSLEDSYMLTHRACSPTLRQYLDRISRLKKAKSKGEMSPLNNFEEQEFDVNYSITLLHTKFQKLRALMLQMGKGSREYDQLVGLTSQFAHFLQKLSDKINPWDNNKTSNHLQRTQNQIKSPRLKLKSPPTIKYDPVATMDLATVQEQFREHLMQPSIVVKSKSSLISTKSKEWSQQLFQSQLNPQKKIIQQKKAALKLNLQNISSKRFFKGKIQRMDSINSTEIQMHGIKS